MSPRCLPADCDGGSFTGSRTAPDTNHTQNGEDCPNATCSGPPIYYRGHYNFVALFTQIIEQLKPTDVLLAGGSAGGMAVYHQCDRAKAILAKNGMGGVKLKCMPDAGLFPGDNWRHPDPGNSWMADSMENKQGLNEKCVAAYERNGSDWRVCMRGAAALRYIETPIFLLNSLYNWCTAYFVSALPVPSAMWKTMTAKIKLLEGFLQGTHASQMDAMAPAIDPSTPHGLFADSCHAHVESSTGCASAAAQLLGAAASV
jgi:hypothetical protein